MRFWSKICERNYAGLRQTILICLFAIALLITAMPWPSAAYKPTATIDLRRIPIGDGRIATEPKVGYVWSCRTEFRGPRRHGAHAAGDWIGTDRTYDITNKPTVNGRVYWQGKFQIATTDTQRQIVSNQLPQDPTGTFPIAPEDDAYRFDRNPNSIRSVAAKFDLPAAPKLADRPACVPMGQVGILLNGGYLFNALDANGKDAVAHEIQDSCQGHPERHGTYHYHSITTCLNDRDPGQGHSQLMGYALDGFGIYGHRIQNGKTATNLDLDVCHGHTHSIDWDGKQTSMYHYHATWEYPYTIGCFRGTPLKLARPRPPQDRTLGEEVPPRNSPRPDSGTRSIDSSDKIMPSLNLQIPDFFEKSGI
jgi:hypothetical protein